jgi:hypothetical protein
VQNFLKMYDNCAYQRCNRLTKTTKLTGDKTTEFEWQALSLWLHEVHDGVNVRLLKEKAVREKQSTITVQDLIEVQWPSIKECPICWSKPDRQGKRSRNETALFTFLQLEYGKRDESTLEFQKQLQMLQNSDPLLSMQLRDVKQPQRPSNFVLTSTFIHPCILVICIIGYVSLGGAGSSYLRRMSLFSRRKLRTQ